MPLHEFMAVARSGLWAPDSGTDACRKSWIKPLKETDLGMALAFFDP